MHCCMHALHALMHVWRFGAAKRKLSVSQFQVPDSRLGGFTVWNRETETFRFAASGSRFAVWRFRGLGAAKRKLSVSRFQVPDSRFGGFAVVKRETETFRFAVSGFRFALRRFRGLEPRHRDFAFHGFRFPIRGLAVSWFGAAGSSQT